MTGPVDLHVHTNASEDGELPPREIIDLAAQERLRAIAFADHDTTASVEEGRALAAQRGIDFLAAVELTTLHRDKDVHVLGYLIDPGNDALLAACARTRESRVEQARGRIEKLRALGIDLDMDRVMEIAAGRPPTSAIILQALRETQGGRPDPRIAPYLTGDKSASGSLNLFLDWFTPGRPCYVPAETLATRDAVGLILGAGGVPVLAHPGRLEADLVEEILECGFGGVEVWSTNHTPEDERFYEALARERGLIATAGSDFHGPGRRTAPLGGLRGGDLSMVDALRAWKR